MDISNPLITQGILNKTELPAPIEGILPGMKFLERRFVLSLFQAGNVKIVEVHDTYVVGEYWVDKNPKQAARTKRPRRKFWKIDGGKLVKMKLDPADGYVALEMGVYTASSGGPIQITGRYPIYHASTGEQVWIGADGQFYNEEPTVSFVRQMQSKHDRINMMSKKRISNRVDDFDRTFTCERCGTETTRKHERKKFCSEYCRVRHHLDNKHHGL